MFIKPFAYVSKQYWMISFLNLRKTELEVYSIIYGFTQDGTEHQISIMYFRKWLGVADATIRRAIVSLKKKKLIRVRNVPGKWSFYACELKPIEDALKSVREEDELKRKGKKGGTEKCENGNLKRPGEEAESFDPYADDVDW